MFGFHFIVLCFLRVLRRFVKIIKTLKEEYWGSFSLVHWPKFSAVLARSPPALLSLSQYECVLPTTDPTVSIYVSLLVLCRLASPAMPHAAARPNCCWCQENASLLNFPHTHTHELHPPRPFDTLSLSLSAATLAALLTLLPLLLLLTPPAYSNLIFKN